jgi:hypothetical protein
MASVVTIVVALAAAQICVAALVALGALVARSLR